MDAIEQLTRAVIYAENSGFCPHCQSPLDPQTAECSNKYRCINGDIGDDDAE